MEYQTHFIVPDWPVPQHVKAYTSLRQGGYSQTPYQSLNLGAHVGDRFELVAKNRQLFQNMLQIPNTIRWLNQVHGTQVAVLPHPLEGDMVADACTTQTAQQVCAILTADCLPILICDAMGTQVAAIHAGWRGLCDGVIEAALAHFSALESLWVWLGPAIGPQHFEVGDDVRAAFILQDPQAELAFTELGHGKWLANLYRLAQQRFSVLGVTQIYGGQNCTYAQSEHFFSYRRDGITGRMATVIWFE